MDRRRRRATRRRGRAARGPAAAALLALAVGAGGRARAGLGGACAGTGDGMGQIAECFIYVGSRLLSLALPEYTLAVDGAGAHHGLMWELPVMVRPGGFRHGLTVAAICFLDVDRWVWRGLYQYRLTSLPWGDDAFPPLPEAKAAAERGWHVHAGLGAFAGGGAAGPSVELRVRRGHIAFGSVFVAAGGERDVKNDGGNRLVVSVGFDAPITYF